MDLEVLDGVWSSAADGLANPNPSGGVLDLQSALVADGHPHVRS